MEQNEVLAKRLKELMEEKGMNYRTLAEESGLPVKRVYRMAAGMTSNPGVFVMMRICKGLGVTLDEFFKAEEFEVFTR